jgi:VCBS repeat-containing protein
MPSISIISKLTGVTNNVEASEITLSSPSIVELKAERADIASITRSNQDMVITLKDGEVITVKNFYAFAEQGGNQLVLEGSDGVLWWVQDTDTAFHFEQIANIDELMAATGAHEGGGAVWPWVLGGLAVAAGIGIAAGSGGGGGGGGDDNANNGNNGGNPGTPDPGGDKTPPTAPTNLNVSADGKTVTGTAEPGSTVTITDGNGKVIGTGTAGSDGHFTVPLTDPKISGEDLNAHATDPSGNNGPSSSVTAPNIPLPDAPTLTNVVDNVIPTVGNVLKNQATNDNTPTLQGKGQAGSTVHIYDNGVEIGKVVVGANGSWSFTPGKALADGSHAFSVTTTNAKGESAHSADFTVTVDTTAPDAPGLNQLKDSTGILTGSISNGMFTDESRPSLGGTGEPGDTVMIFDKGTKIGQVTVGEDGKWSFTPTQPLAEGSHTIYVQQVDPAGNLSLSTSGPTFIVDTTPPPAVSITNVSVNGTTVSGTGEPGSLVTIYGPDNVKLGGPVVVGPNGKFTLTLTPAQTHGESLSAHVQDAAGNVGPDKDFTASASGYPTVPVLNTVTDDVGPSTGTLKNGQSTDDSKPTLSGTAEAGSLVTIYNNGVILGTATTDGTGHWTFTPAQPLADGQHTFTFTATTSNGTSGTSGGFTVGVDTVAPAAPGNLDVSDDGKTVTGTAEAGSTVTITDGDGNPIGSATAGSDGKFTVTISPPQINGETLGAAATDPAGNTSGQATVVAPDHIAPDGPIITGLLDDEGTITGQITANGVTNDTTPTLSGTGEAGDTITIFDNGVKISTVTVDGSGNWSFTPTTPLSEGPHTLSVQQTDPAGNTSPIVSGPAFTIDITPPPAVVITDVSVDGSTVTGTAQPGSLVSITGPGNVLLGAPVVADADGKFTITLSPAQTHGESLTAHVQDAAGNAGPDTGFIASDSNFPTVPVLDTVLDDVAPSTGNLSNGQSTNDSTPTLSGTGEIGSIINIFNNGVLLGVAPVDGTGHWTFTPLLPLLNGEHNFTLTATNGSGTSAASAGFTVNVDTQAPAAPTDLDVSADGKTVTGTAEAGSTITITDSNGNPIGSATAGTDGKFTVTISPPQLNGETLGATATDAAGNKGPNTPVVAEDHTPPAAPSDLAVSADGLHVTGSAEAGSTVTITDGNGNILGTGTAGPDGKFDVTPLTPAQDNGETLLVTATDAANNSSPDATVIAQDNTAPDAPTDVKVNEEGTIVTGNAEAGSTVTVTDGDGTTLGTGTADGDGKFSVPITPPQTNGETLDVSATDNAGHTGPATPVEAPDTTAPEVPIITSVYDDVDLNIGNLTNGQTTNDDKPTLTGTAEANSTVKIYDNGTLLTTITADGSGNWSYTPTTALNQGSHNLTVTATDGHGNTSPAASFTVVVDSIAPLTPAITLISDNVGTITGPVANNGVTNDSTPTINGTGEPGSTVTLYNGTDPVTTLVVDSSGTWSYTPATPLPDATYSYTVKATDAAGNTTGSSAVVTITVDTVAPDAPAFTTVIDTTGSITTPLVSGSTTDETRPQITGTGTTGSTITIYDNGNAIGTATVVGGTWTFTPTQPLSEGPHALTAVASDAAGNASAAGSFNLTVDLTPPTAPSILTADGNVGGVAETLISGGSTQTTTPELSGKGEPGATVEIFNNGASLGTTTVDQDGNWTFTTPVLAEGPHSLTAVATDAAGNVGLASPGFNLTVDNTPPVTPAIPIVVDDQAPGLGNIAANGSTNDTTPTFTGTGTAGDTITLYNGAATLGTTTVRADGSWSFTPSTALPQAQYTVHVVETDPAGNSSQPSGNIVFTVDTTAPDAPIVLNADDDVGAVTGPLPSGSVTDDSTPVFHGTGNAGDTITLYNGSTVVGTAVVGVGGTWTLTPTAPLPNGTLNLTATATDPAGNTSGPSTSFDLTVNSTPLTLPVITEILDNVGAIQTPLVNGSYTDDFSPTLTGTGTVGSTVTVYDTDGTTVLGSAVVGVGGTWSITTSNLGDGAHTLTVRATDAAGNAVGPTAPITLNVDTVDPAAPTGVTISNDGTIVTGSAEANSTVIIKDAGGNEIGRGLADGTGAFTVTVAPAQTHEEALTATAQDRAGNQGDPSDFTGSDSGLPPAPVITNALDDVGTLTGPLDNGKSTDDTTPTLNGTAEAGATVNVYQDGVLLGTTVADGTGAWTYPITAALSEGPHSFTVSQTVEVLGVSETSGQSPNFTLTVDMTAPTAPLLTSVTDDVAPGIGNVDTGQPTNDASPTFNGTGEAGSTISIFNNGTLLGTAVVTAGGTWSYTPASGLSDGNHTITFSSADAAGNTTPGANSFNLIVDTGTPTAPVITGAIDDNGTVEIPILSGQPTNDGTPTLNGTAEANSVITLSDNGKVIGTTTSDENGAWNFTPTTPLGDGSHSLTVTVTDAAGNVSAPSDAFNVVVDTVAPIVPLIVTVIDDQTVIGTNTPLTNGQLTKDSQPTLNGTSEANATITIKDGTTVLGTATANASGAWSFTPAAPLGQGSHTLTVTATDVAGNTSNPSSSFVVTVDSVAPNAPVILTVTDNTAPVTGPITSGQPTNETRPAITGTGEVGSTITVYDGSTALGTTVVGAGGTWSFTPAAPLGTGSHPLTVTATDTAGNVSAPSGNFNVVVDTTAPVAPAITIVTDDVGTVTGNLTSGQVTDDSRPALTGTAEANAIITVYDNGSAIGTAQANGSGAWSFTPGTALGNGSHALTVTATDAAGNVSPPSGPFNVIVDTQAPTSPIVIQAVDDVGPVTGNLVSGQSTNDKQPALSGTAEANSTVKIYDNGALIGTVTASGTGTWSFTPGTALSEGVHVFTATSTDAAGNLGSVSAGFTLNIDSIAPTTPLLTSVVDDVAGGVFNGPLTNGQVTNDARPTLNGTAEVGSTITILDGGTAIGTVTVPAGGVWSFTPTTPLTGGSHTLTVTATDAAGNVSSPTAGFTVVVDTTAPTLPVISSIVDDVGSITGPITNLPTNDTLPTLNGTAEAGATVNIFDNGVLLGSAVANGSGVWTYTPTVPLTEGNHSFTVTATDTAGNTSGASLPSAIVVDITPPAAPTGMVVNGTGTTVTGTAEAGSTVTITSSAGTVLGTATADGTGSFSVTISPAQTSGQALIAVAQDSAGNLGASAGFTAPFTGVPGVPIISSVVDDTSPQTGTVGNGQSTNDTTPTLNGTAQAGATVNVYNNGVLMGTTTANGSGVWSYTPTGNLSEGSHAFTATATNANGTGSPSAAATVIVDTIAPTIPTAVISADGTTVSGVAEANSTVTITLPGGITVTTTANASGAYSTTLPTRQIDGESLSVNATDAAGNTSPSFSLTAPVLPLAADNNVVNLDLTTDAQTTSAHYSDYGTLLVGALGNVASVLGSDTAQVGFTIADGGTGNITINAAATGVVLSLLNTLEVAIQKYDSATGTWSTIIDSSLPQFANLLTLGASGVTLDITGLGGGTYRVLSYNTSLLATGSLTSLDVSVVQTSAGTITSGTTHPGNVITDIDPSGGQDTAPAGTVVSSVTNSQGVVTTVGAGGADIQGLYGTLHINQDGSYTYTLTNTSASVIGRTENFTYTISHSGASSSAQLVVTLGNGAPASTVTATDNTAALTYNTDVEAVNHGASQQNGFSVVGVGLGNVLSLNVLANMANPIIFDVDNGSTRTMTLQASVGGVALLSTFDLYVYKFNDVTQQFEQYQVVKTWLTAPLLGGSSGQLTMTLPGGEYLFLLNNASGVTVLTSYTLNILQDHTYAVDSVSATTTGNVMADDIAPAGSHVTQVNGVAVAASGTTVINGQYGTLTIDANGNYTYKLNGGQGADSIKTPDSFVYTVTAPNGDTGTASLNVTATPHTVDAIDDTSSLMSIATAQNTAAYSDTSVGTASWNAALLVGTSGNGSGTFVVDSNTVLHNPVLHFSIASLLPLGGVGVTWTLSDGTGVVKTGSFSGAALLGGVANVDLTGMDLHSGTWTLSYTGTAGALGVGNITITPSVTGTTVDLDSYSTLSGSTVHGNLYDGSDAAGAVDQLGSVHTLMTITGFNGSTATLNPLTNSSATATIQGHYGTLQIGIDGSYTYTLNSGVSPASITTQETFTYSLNDQNGHTDSATLTINMNPQFVSTAQSDVINGSVYSDTLVYHLLNSSDATGGNGADTWNNFSLTQGDKINVHDLLTGWNGSQSTLGNYLNVTTSGNNTVISIDRDGTGSTYHSTTLVTLENTHTTLDELVQQNHIIT